jgi:hypothetical protein
MTATAFSARTNYFRADADVIRDALADHPTIEVRSRQDDEGEWWHALATGDSSYVERRAELLELGLKLGKLIDKRDAIAAFFVGFDKQDHVFGRTVLVNHEGEVGRVDLSDIYRVAGDNGIVLRAAED